jgi:hypothetical protein
MPPSTPRPYRGRTKLERDYFEKFGAPYCLGMPPAFSQAIRGTQNWVDNWHFTFVRDAESHPEVKPPVIHPEDTLSQQMEDIEEYERAVQAAVEKRARMKKREEEREAKIAQAARVSLLFLGEFFTDSAPRIRQQK